MSELKQSDNQKEYISSKIVFLWKTLNDEKDLLNLVRIACFARDPKNHQLIEQIFLKQKNVTDIAISGGLWTLRQLHYFAYSKDDDSLYKTFQIPKKKRGVNRTINAPNLRLKEILKCLNYIFQQIYIPNKYVIGFVPNRSIVDGAKVHLSQKFIYNIDLKDFFPSISSGRIYKRLLSHPFNLNPQIASLVANLCCYKNEDKKLVLPQGAPTSPTISNFICERLDRKLSKLASAYRLKYTRYADDITFSGMRNVFSEDGKFCKSLRNIIENEEHFTINESKTRLCHKGMRQEVTGLTINEKVNVSRKYVKQLRTMINNWEKMGYEEAQSRFFASIAKSRAKYIERNEFALIKAIGGKLNFLRMVKSESDPTYKKLKERFYKLNSDPNNNIQTIKNTNKNVVNNKMIDNEQCSISEQLWMEHDPEFVSRFLHQFTEQECEALKFTTHYWDKNSETNEYNYENFKELKSNYIKILNNGNKSLYKYRDLYAKHFSKNNKKTYKPSLMNILRDKCYHLWKIIQTFLVEQSAEYCWGEFNLHIGYNKYLEAWMNENPNKEPFLMELSYLPKKYQPKELINGKQLFNFGDVVDIFKRSIQFRDDDLFRNIKKIFKSSDININREQLESLEGCSFYTDTFLVTEALKVIAGNIKQRPEHPDVEIKCVIENGNEKETISIEILQIESFSYRDIFDDKIKLNCTDGGVYLIKSKLKNLCDFSIESLFRINGEVKPIRINYLSSNFDNYQEYEEIPKQMCRGFKYILQFYNYKSK